jgi:hypothetical protein
MAAKLWPPSCFFHSNIGHKKCPKNGHSNIGRFGIRWVTVHDNLSPEPPLATLYQICSPVFRCLVLQKSPFFSWHLNSGPVFKCHLNTGPVIKGLKQNGYLKWPTFWKHDHLNTGLEIEWHILPPNWTILFKRKIYNLYITVQLCNHTRSRNIRLVFRCLVKAKNNHFNTGLVWYSNPHCSYLSFTRWSPDNNFSNCYDFVIYLGDSRLFDATVDRGVIRGHLTVGKADD